MPVAPIREAFEASGLSAWELAGRLGWHKRTGRGLSYPDSTRVRRVLGYLATNSTSRSGTRYRYPPSLDKTVRLSVAQALTEALGLDPVDVGL